MNKKYLQARQDEMLPFNEFFVQIKESANDVIQPVIITSIKPTSSSFILNYIPSSNFRFLNTYFVCKKTNEKINWKVEGF